MRHVGFLTVENSDIKLKSAMRVEWVDAFLNCLSTKALQFDVLVDGDTYVPRGGGII